LNTWLDIVGLIMSIRIEDVGLNSRVIRFVGPTRYQYIPAFHPRTRESCDKDRKEAEKEKEERTGGGTYSSKRNFLPLQNRLKSTLDQLKQPPSRPFPIFTRK